jgi:hypothetical protein
MEWRIESPFIASEFSVGTPGGKEFDWLLRQILNAPCEQPAIAPDFAIPTKLPYRDLGPIVTHGCTSNENLWFQAPPQIVFIGDLIF